MMDLITAIAREEGFFHAGTRPQRDNNPGDIEYGKFAIAHGATGTDGRFAIFPDAASGFACMAALLTTAYVGMTLDAALQKWAPSSENNHIAYVAAVIAMTGLTPDTVITPDIIRIAK